MATTKIVLDADIRAFKKKAEEMSKILTLSIGKKHVLDMDTGALDKVKKVGGEAYDNLIKKSKILAESVRESAKENLEYIKRREETLDALTKKQIAAAKEVAKLESQKKVLPVGFNEAELNAKKKIKENADLQLELTKRNLNEEYDEKKKKALQLNRELKQNGQDRLDARSSMGSISRGGANLKEFAAKVKGGKGGWLGKVPGMGGMAKGLGGAMMGLGKVAGPAGMIATAGIGAYMGARALTGPAREMAGMNLDLRGLSRKDRSSANLRDMQGAGIDQGYSPFEMMQANIQAQRNLGEMNSGDSRELATLSRQQGMGLGEVSNFASSFRKNAVGAEGASAKESLSKTRAMFTEAYIAAFDKSGQLAYMEAMTSGIEEMADGGTADVKMLSSVLSGLAQQSEFFKTDARRSGKVASGMKDLFQNRSGFATAALTQALDKEGIKYDPAQLQALQGSGLFETSNEQYAEELGMKRDPKTKKFSDEDLNKAERVRKDALDNLMQIMYKNQSSENPNLLKTNLQAEGFSASLAQEIAKVVSSNESLSADKKLMDEIRKEKGGDKDLEGNDLNTKRTEAQLLQSVIDGGKELLKVFNLVEGNVGKIADKLLGNSDSEKSSHTLDFEAKQIGEEGTGFFTNEKALKRKVLEKEAAAARARKEEGQSKEGDEDLINQDNREKFKHIGRLYSQNGRGTVKDMSRVKKAGEELLGGTSMNLDLKEKYGLGSLSEKQQMKVNKETAKEQTRAEQEKKLIDFVNTGKVTKDSDVDLNLLLGTNNKILQNISKKLNHNSAHESVKKSVVGTDGDL